MSAWSNTYSACVSGSVSRRGRPCEARTACCSSLGMVSIGCPPGTIITEGLGHGKRRIETWELLTNALHLPLEAGATQERRLDAVRYKRWLAWPAGEKLGTYRNGRYRT